MMNLASLTSQTITQHAIFQKDGLILVAVSGGADSIALLLILQDLGYQLHALHCNFHLRGEESDRDMQFVENLCSKYSIPLTVNHFNTTAYAKEHKMSIEMAAREQRYRWFNDQRQALHAQAIAVAHHRDDQAETLLLNIIRGTGLRGLAGMSYVNGNICRPLLDASRNDILAYLTHRGQDFVTDSTNLERDAMRNRIRLDILPALAELNPSIHQTLARLASNIQDALPIYEQGLNRVNAKSTETSPFSESPFTLSEASLTLLHEWTTACGFNRTQLQNILKAETGSIIESSTHRLLRDRTHFILHNKNIAANKPVILTETLPASEVGKMQNGIAYLDKSKVLLPLCQRTVQPSDRFTPFGMKGTKLVSDYLTDLKINRFEKETQEIVADAQGHILWIVGHATDNHYRITPATQEVLKMQVITASKTGREGK